MRKLTGLIALLLGILPSCTKPVSNYLPPQKEPIITEKVLADETISKAHIYAIENSKWACKLAGMTDEEYEGTLKLLKENEGKISRSTCTHIKYPKNPSLDYMLIMTRIGDQIVEYIDIRADGYILDGDDQVIDEIRYYPEGYTGEVFGITGDKFPEYNARVIEMVNSHRGTLKKAIDN